MKMGLACYYLRLITAGKSFIAHALEMPDLSSIGSHECCQGIQKGEVSLYC
jgi:hypothetical protein